MYEIDDGEKNGEVVDVEDDWEGVGSLRKKDEKRSS